MLQAKLVVVGGDAKSKEVRLKLPAILGRGRECTLTVPQALVSRLHCQITERDGRLYVKDLGSLNGTYIDNFRIEGEQPLMPDQLLTIGTITFRACYVPGVPVAGDADAEQRATCLPVEGKSQHRPTLKTVSAPTVSSAPVRHQTTIPAPPPQVVAASATLGNDHARDSKPMAPAAGSSPDSPCSDDASPNHLRQPSIDETSAIPAIPEPSDDRVQIELDQPLSAEKSICVQALANLPHESANLSFSTPIVIADTASAPPASVSSVEILADAHQPNLVDSQDQALASFLRKLPR